MPIYEYECPQCGRFEKIQKFSDKPLSHCPQCDEAGRKSVVTKAVSASAFHLKGSGWYKTDYSSGSTSTANKSESKSGTAAGDTAKAGSKSEAPARAGKACGTGCGCH